MAKFYYKALKDNKIAIDGEVEAATPREARAKIRDLGYLPTSIYSEEAREKPAKPDVVKDVRVKRLSLQEKMLFTSELQVLLSSGIPIIEALHSIEINTPKRKLMIIARNLRKGIECGLTFSKSMEQYRHIFGPVFMGLCISGEASGELEQTLDRMLGIFNKQDWLKGKIIRAMIYPSILVLMMGALLALFAFWIFPVLKSIAGDSVPASAQALCDFTLFTFRYGLWILAAAAGAWHAAVNVFQNTQLKKAWDSFIMRVPLISQFLRYCNLSNFLSVLSVSYDAGVPVVEGINLAEQTLKSFSLKQKTANVLSRIKQGLSLTDSFSRADMLPSDVIMIVSTGEKSGTLGQMLKNASELMDKKVNMAVEAMARLIEPVIIIVIGIFVGFIALSFYSTIMGAMMGAF
ncbi:MAG: type II secretion system F family protein [Heliobacteriaceae bacterium]|jgi:type II secretory pathway component PulF|nr:type II secretion system F family protein [Heliobacteriaceae bacterium]